ncbi:MAG: hypothetical protein GX793_01515 [Bacteroidales bacterium]|jgi:hypothetical protein|nr:hypothetical protein [Bacteroidales bacterium]MCK9499960.1 hypothetical protein [Bacteroidales bacterium]MDY0315661.1 hypothetical protein [Bacteroidales bacterium]NLB85717.1 hypothetical protein [Bacteroidales bacterium]
MGMFDELEIDKKFLPEDLQEHETGWQTKSYYSTLDTLVINKDGKLLLINNWGEGREVEETNYTGEIRFYDSVNKIWTEFVAFFENGQMFKIVQIAPKVEKEIL